MKNWYKNLESRFTGFPKQTQVLHMVSDLKKAAGFRKENPETSRNHLLRAMILLDYMICDPKWKSGLKELLRLREVMGSILMLPEPYGNLNQVIRAAVLMEPEAYKLQR